MADVDVADRPWAGSDRGYRALLEALAKDRLAQDAVERERLASSRRQIVDVHEAQREAEKEVLAEVRDDVSVFRSALDDAWNRAAGAHAVYDGSDPEQSALADALIQYLVRPGYAEVETTEQEQGHYLYRVQVDWERLRALYAEANP